MNDYNNLGFHDSSVVRLSLTNGHFEMELEDVSTRFQKVNVVIFISAVTQAVVNDEAARDIQMLEEDGSVLTLDVTQDRLFFLIEWTNFAAHTTKTCGYEILGSDLQLNVIS